MKDIKESERALSRFLQLAEADNAAYLQTLSAVFHLLTVTERLEKSGVPRDEITSFLAPAREIVRESPFYCRMQEWPRGYQGDFETVEYLMSSVNQSCPPDGGIAWYLEQYGLTSPAAQQHRNKVQRQAELIAKKCRSKPDARVLVIACGSSPDVALAQPYISSKASITLYDYDKDALAFSRKRLRDMGETCCFVHGNVYRIDRDFQDSKPFDLVITGGLFDYVKDAAVVRILRHIWSHLLADDGLLFFTNMSPDNPDRVWIEYLADWRLIMRDEKNLSELCVAAGIPADMVYLSRDQTNVTIMAEATHNNKNIP